jgi:hypothetical protein
MTGTGEVDENMMVDGGKGGGRGYDGGRGGGRDGGGGGGGQRPTTMTVKTNYFHLIATNNVDKGEWIKYDIEIIDAIRRKKKGPDGNYLEPWQFEFVPWLLRPKNESGEPIEKTVSLEKGTMPVSRRILIKLQKNLLDEKPLRYFVVCNDVFGPSAIRLMVATSKHSLPENCLQTVYVARN